MRCSASFEKALSFMVPIMILVTPLLLMSWEGAGLTRAAGTEEMDITITVLFRGPTDYGADVNIEVHKLLVDGNLTSADEFRALYLSDPEGTASDIEVILRERARSLIDSSFSEDSINATSAFLHLDTLDNDTSEPGDPVVFDITFEGSSPYSRYFPEDRIDDVPDDRKETVITSLLLAGFSYTRDVVLRAQTGQNVNYRIPTSFDPFGDGLVQLILVSGRTPVDGYYEINIDGDIGGGQAPFTIDMRGSGLDLPDDESIDGTVLADWYRLDRVDINSDIEVLSIDVAEREVLTDLPERVHAPDFISSDLVRYLNREGLVDQEDISGTTDEVSSEIESRLESGLDVEDVTVDTDFDWNNGGIVLPSTGGELMSILEEGVPLLVSAHNSDEIELDILDGYNLSDVMGLLHGGIRIERQFELDDNGEYQLEIMLPSHLMFTDQVATGMVGDRMVYPMATGTRTISSDLAPDYSDQKVEVISDVDLSGFTSHYMADASMEISVETLLMIDHVDFDEGDYPIDTTLDYELDHLSSDLIRLAVRMGLLKEEDLLKEVRERHVEMFSDIVKEEDQEVMVSIADGSLEFDDDILNMTGDDPLLIEVRMGSDLDPMGAISGKTISSDTGNRVLPVHFDPILPVRKFERTIGLGEDDDWDLNINITLPTGLGVEAYLGMEQDHKLRKLDVEIVDGYPTLHVLRYEGEGDHIFISITVGSYLVVNNVTCCFASLVIFPLLFILLVLIKIVKKARKGKKKEEKGEKEGEGEDLQSGARERDNDGST